MFKKDLLHPPAPARQDALSPEGGRSEAYGAMNKERHVCARGELVSRQCLLSEAYVVQYVEP